ncbi:U3 snoRNP protein, partial [Tieghemiomyces parasiticus]
MAFTESLKVATITPSGKLRHKFTSFRARLDATEINVTRRLVRHLDEPEVQGSYFQEALAAWTELNCSIPFTRFVRAVTPLCGSLPALLFHRDAVVSLLLEHLQVSTPHSAPALLDLIAVLARDLLEEFLPHLEPVVQALGPLARFEHAATVEGTFRTLTLLFKHLLPFLTPDLRPSFRGMESLLGATRHKPHVRRFAAESCAYLLRKCPRSRLRITIPFILARYRARPNPTYAEGLALMFYEAMKSSEGRTHSRALPLWTELIGALGHSDNAADKAEGEAPAAGDLSADNAAMIDPATVIVDHLLRMLMLNMVADDVTFVESTLVRGLRRATGAAAQLPILALLTTLAGLRGGELLTDLAALAQAFTPLASLTTATSAAESQSLTTAITDLGLTLLAAAPLDVALTLDRAWLAPLFAQAPPAAVLPLAQRLLDLNWSHWVPLLLPRLVAYTKAHYTAAGHVAIFAAFWDRLLQADGILDSALAVLGGAAAPYRSPTGQLVFPGGDFPAALLDRLTQPIDWARLGQLLGSEAASGDVLEEIEGDNDHLAVCTILALLPRLYLPSETTIATLDRLAQALTDYLTTSGIPVVDGPGFALACVLGTAVRSRLAFQALDPARYTAALEAAWPDHFDHFLLVHTTNPAVLTAFGEYAAQLNPAVLTSDHLARALPALLPNLASPHADVRRSTLGVLSRFQPLPALSTRPNDPAEPCPVFQLALAMEDIEPTFENYRDRLAALRRLSVPYTTRRVPATYLEVLPQLCLGNLAINLKPVWEAVAAVLRELAVAQGPRVWRLLLDRLLAYDGRAPLGSTRPTKPVMDAHFNLMKQVTDPTAGFQRLATVKAGVRTDDNRRRQVAAVLAREYGLITDTRDVSLAAFVRLTGFTFERVDLVHLVRQVYAVVAVAGPRLLARDPTVYGQLVAAFLRDRFPIALRTLPSEPTLPDGTSLAALVADLLRAADALDVAYPRRTSPAYSRLVGNRSLKQFQLTQCLLLLSRAEAGNPLPTALPYLLPAFLNLVSSTDASLQELSIGCVLVWRPASDLALFRAAFRRMLAPTRCREELSRFPLAPGALEPASARPEVINLVLRLLFGRINDTSGRFRTNTDRVSRQQAAFVALTRVGPSEAQLFFDLLLAPFRPTLLAATGRAANDDSLPFPIPYDRAGQFHVPPGADLLAAVGGGPTQHFLTLALELVQHFGVALAPFAPQLLSVALNILVGLEREIQQDLQRRGFQPVEQDSDEEDHADDDDQSDDGDVEDEEIVNAVRASDRSDEESQGEEVEEEEEDGANTQLDSTDATLTVQAPTRRRRRTPAALRPRDLRHNRGLVLRLLVALFQGGVPATIDLTPFLPHLVAWAVTPRLPSFAAENHQAPSALLTLLAAWTTRPAYLTFLATYDPAVFPAVLGLLRTPQAARAVTELVVTMMEQVVEYANTAGTEGAARTVAKRLIADHADVVLDSIGHLLGRQQFRGPPAATLMARRLLTLLTRCAPHVTGPTSLARLLDLLLPVIRLPTAAAGLPIKMQVLSVFNAVLPVLLNGPLSTGFAHPGFLRYFQFVCQLFDVLHPLRARQQVVALLKQLAAVVQPSGQLVVSVPLVADLNAVLDAEPSARDLRPDVARRIQALTTLAEPDAAASVARATLTGRDWLPLVYNLLALVGDFETPEAPSLRGGAMQALTRFLQDVREWDPITKRHNDPLSIGFCQSLDAMYVRARRGLASPDPTLRSVWLSLLVTMAGTYPRVGQLFGLAPLLGGDRGNGGPGFSDVLHVRSERQVAALNALSDRILHAGSAVPEGTYRDLIFPAINPLILGPDADVDPPVRRAAVAVLSAAVAGLSWPAYRRQLLRLVKELTRSNAGRLDVHAVAALVAVASAFPFDAQLWVNHTDLLPTVVSSSGPTLQPATTDNATAGHPVLADREGDSDSESDDDDDGSDAMDNDMAVESPTDLQSRVRTSHAIHESVLADVLPALKTPLVDHKSYPPADRVRLAGPLITILLRLPLRSSRPHLGGLITTMASLLSNKKEQEVRDVARRTLERAVSELGPSYLPFVLEELRSATRKGGVKLAILNFTTNAVLAHTVSMPDPPVGVLDPSLELALGIAARELFPTHERGEMLTTRIRRDVREAMATGKGLGTLKMLAQHVSFAKSGRLLAPFRTAMAGTDSTATMSVVDAGLDAVAKGLAANRDPDTFELLVLCHGLIGRHLALTTAPRARGPGMVKIHDDTRGHGWRLIPIVAGDTIHTVYANRAAVQGETDHFSGNVHRFVVLGLRLFSRALRHRFRPAEADRDTLGRLDPFVDLLGNCLYSTYPPVVAAAVEAFRHLVVYPLPTFGDTADLLVARLLDLIRTAGSSQLQLLRACAETLQATLATHRDLSLSGNQLGALLSFVSAELDRQADAKAYFALLWVVLKRRLLAAELYDVMDKAGRLLVTSHDGDLRSRCRQAYLHFLLHYPMGADRWRAHLDLLLSGLDYRLEAGRTSALELTHDLVRRLPPTLLAQGHAVLFLGLANVLINDDAASCRGMAGVVLTRLGARLEPSHLGTALRMLDHWAKGGAPVVARLSVSLHRQDLVADFEEELSAEPVVATSKTLPRPDRRSGLLSPALVRPLRLARASVQMYGLLLDARAETEDENQAGGLPGAVSDVLSHAHRGLVTSELLWRTRPVAQQDAVAALISDGDAETPDSAHHGGAAGWLQWESGYLSLITLAKLFVHHPAALTAATPQVTALWRLVISHLVYPHAWVRLAAARLLGQAFAMSPDPTLDRPAGTYYLTTEALRSVLAHHITQLNGRSFEDDLGTQLVKNVFFIGKCFHRHATPHVLAVAEADGGDIEPMDVPPTAPHRDPFSSDEEIDTPDAPVR